ncbi:4-hydroxyphenylpyruvate dioxygenase [Rothia sp. P3C3.S176]|uniref:4-hydroxyphenylpyruvate dioxygenase n=1 Tax=Rothia sp. P3C3.S176 TaxID=2962204 RepID=UPI0020C87ED1|nr:4-hydroxyphenylpyruvate dioxygenase [Rothia sp. P3C3.S176]MCP8995735.1 4-hydroxyphenylpyruvate dioxygenase [Rothia sp. P3C3.S176]
MSTPPQNTPNNAPQQPTPNNGTPQNQQVPPRAPQQAPQNMIPQPRGPQRKKPRKPIDTIEQQKANIRTSLMMVVAALVIFSASSFVLSTMPLFLALFIFALAGITLSIIAIVRTAVYRGPWFFYIAAGVSIIYGAITLLGGIGLALMPGAQEYRECRAAALTQTDMYTCDQKFQGTIDKLTGASSSSSSAR